MSIVGSWTISNHVELRERYTHPLIMTGHTVVITDQPASSNARVEVFNAADLLCSGEVAYHNTTRKDSIHGRIQILGSGEYCYISAYARMGIDYVYIFGMAETKTATDDSGGQWDGNRPR